jgi:hypothetical protein
MDTTNGAIMLDYNLGPHMTVVDRDGTAYHGTYVADDARGVLLSDVYYYAPIEKNQVIQMPIGPALFPWFNIRYITRGKPEPPNVMKMG